MDSEILVSVLCTAYNHEKYIRQCLDGFVNQKTNFKYEVLINDDASTDNTAAVIKEYERKYPDLIKPVYQPENQYSKGIFIIAKYLLPLAKGKYVAICEGDDWWCDENKLQCQFDAMEANPNCHLCLHKVQGVDENGMPNRRQYPDCFVPKQLTSKAYYKIVLSEKYQFQTSCYFRRTEDVKNYYYNKPDFVKAADVGDRPTLLYFGFLGDVVFLDKTMSCYRMGSIGSWSSKTFGDKELIKNHDLSMLHMLEEFDVFSSCKYTRIIKKKCSLYFAMAKELELPQDDYCREMLKKCNHKYYRFLPPKWKLFIFTNIRFSWLIGLYHRIKNKINK